MKSKIIPFILLFWVSAVSTSAENSESLQTRIQYQKPLVPIILVPGIGGSILWAKTSQRSDQRIWVSVTNADLWASYLSIYDENIVYTPYWVDYGLYAIRNLDPDLLYKSDATHYFLKVIDSLQEIGYVPGKTLFGFPYDWRKSIHDIASDSRLHSLVSNFSNCIIISHSMGGLVIENYLRRSGSKNVDAWITLGTPFKGAGGNALKSLIDGYSLDHPYILNMTFMAGIAREAHSVYSLLPQESLAAQPYVIEGDKVSDALSYLRNLPTFHYDRYLAQSRSSARINFSCPVYYIGNTAIRTPFDYLRSSANQFSVVPGDGTVPLNSAFHAHYHNQPLQHEFDLKLANPEYDHFHMLRSDNVNYLCRLLSLNICRSSGSYFHSARGVISILDEGAIDLKKQAPVISRLTLNGVSIDADNLLIYYDCVTVEYDGAEFRRNIGAECAKYERQDYLYPSTNLRVMRECISGYYVNTSSSLCSNGVYDMQSQQCLTPTSQPTPAPTANRPTIGPTIGPTASTRVPTNSTPVATESTGVPTASAVTAEPTPASLAPLASQSPTQAATIPNETKRTNATEAPSMPAPGGFIPDSLAPYLIWGGLCAAALVFVALAAFGILFLVRKWKARNAFSVPYELIANGEREAAMVDSDSETNCEDGGHGIDL